ncbi:hypothetical protein J3R30DRAFT_3404373 [Lentinula aciculospora]|uniref:CCD97-like C-terminal domain-containing protein n=1 Tax=Lentinula aciculospora TaxID=153920 RepID=A0A9W9DP47_9AGAR|nr:hypothetical protein J3R30DRAFT_3404373 [Lentinula aciculospora]
MPSEQSFETTPILTYLGLEKDGSYSPSPSEQPIEFLVKHINHLPPHLLLKFSSITSPKERTVIHVIRNRRLKYIHTQPAELSFTSARHTWLTEWPGRERRGVEEGHDEEHWAQSGFMEGTTKYVKKLGPLLRDYEEEREAERVRTIRRTQSVADESRFIPEEDSDEDSNQDEDVDPSIMEAENEVNNKAEFVRHIRERFIYGLLDNIDYDKVDWDESLDTDNDREAEERWFDDDED